MSRRMLGWLVALVVLAAGLPLGAAAQDATPEAASAPLDVAAMTLTPLDLADLGFDGYVVADGRTQTVADRAAEQAAADGDDPAQVEAFLGSIGWVRGYRARLTRPLVEGEEGFDSLILTGVTQYADEDGARTGYNLLSALDAADGAATPIANAASIGDRSTLIALDDVSLDDGKSHAARRLVFQHGVLVGDVITFAAPDLPIATADIEAMATRLLERIDATIADGGPGLSLLVQRWTGFGFTDPDLDNYLIRDGEVFATLGETPEEVADAAADVAGATDFYRYEAAISQTAFQYTSVVQFPDEARASDYVTNTFARTDADRPEGSTLEEVTDAPAFGAESVMLHITVPTSSGNADGYAVFARFGDQAIGLAFVSLGPLDVDSVLSMAELQMDCFAAGDCTAAADPPAGFGG